MLNIVDIVLVKLSYHTKMNLHVFHAESTELKDNMNSPKVNERKKIYKGIKVC